MKIRLADEDRERLGGPDELDCSIDPFTVRDAELIEDETGIEPYEALGLMLPDREELDETRVRLRWKPKGLRLRVWLGLRRAGVDVPFGELTFSYLPFLGSSIIEKPPSPGKDEPPTADAGTP